MKTSDFDYHLPEDQIAQTPAYPRDSSRMLVIHRPGGKMEHRVFRDIGDYLQPGDLLVVNRTRVIPARLIGRKDTGARVEVMLLKRLDLTRWETLVRPGRKILPGTRLVFGEGRLTAVCEEKVHATGGRILEFSFQGVFEDILEELGTMPLPPYITSKLEDQERYQTVYAREKGSAAAPTAGLHFTRELLDRLDRKGVQRAEVLLHVGLGTFRPVSADDIREHRMHEEWYQVPEETARMLRQARQEGRRIIAVGTTTVRTLEALVEERGGFEAHSGETDIFIYPGYSFRAIDGMITNFHLPKSTLVMLVSAFLGRERTLEAYQEAVRQGYRFFSFGDSMMILPGEGSIRDEEESD